MPIELYHDSSHSVMLFSDFLPSFGMDSFSTGQITAAPSNQILLMQQDQGILLDPGGLASYSNLFMAISRYFSPKDLCFLAVSHCSPNSAHSIGRWLVGARTELLISQQLLTQLPHLCDPDRIADRVHGIPDSGAVVHCGGIEYLLLPAHFLGYSAGLQLYDPVSRILFSGILGASEVSANKPITGADFSAHTHQMRALHIRHIASRRVCSLWVNMVRNLDIEMIVPQHGAPIVGEEAINAFYDWIQELPCGTDILTQDNFLIPRQHGRAAIIGWDQDLQFLQRSIEHGDMLTTAGIIVTASQQGIKVRTEGSIEP